jgi:hypothetical protein
MHRIPYCSGRSSDFRIILITASSQKIESKRKILFLYRFNPSSDIMAAFVPDYSDGLAPDFHGIPCWANGT